MPGLNNFTVPSWVAMEPLRLLLNELEIAGSFSSNWNDEFDKEFAVGETITVKKPNRFIAVDGLELEEQPLDLPTTTITINQPFHVAFSWDDFEKVINMEKPDDQIRRLYLKPAAEEMKQQIESRAALFAYRNTPSVFGILGTNPTSSSPFLDARDRMFTKAGLQGTPPAFISSRMMTSFLTNQAVQFNPQSDIAKQYKAGVVDAAAGLEWVRTNSLYRHVAGTWAGAVTVSGAGQSGSTLNVVCTTGDTFKAGDSFSIANVNFVNPSTRRVPAGNQVQHFLVTADTTGVAAAAALPIFPAIVGPGSPFQNVDALPANAAALTLWPGTSSPNGKSGTQGLVIGNDAFAIVGAKYERPPNVVCSYARDPKTGLSIRFTRQWDIKTSKTYSRWDMAVGFGVLYADENAARVVGA